MVCEFRQTDKNPSIFSASLQMTHIFYVISSIVRNISHFWQKNSNSLINGNLS